MMNKEDFKNLMGGISVICTIAAVIKANMIQSGFTQEEASATSTEFILDQFRNAKEMSKDDD